MPSFRRTWIAVIAVTLSLGAGAGSAPAQSDEAASLLQRIQELTEGSTGRFLTPVPDSRSIVLAIDTSTPLFFYLERGSIRGSAIDTFYSALETGDMDAAYDAFIRNAIMTVRVTDYGWNGLGTPMTTESGTEVGRASWRERGW